MTGQLLQHLGGTGKSVTRLSDGDVENELLDLQLPHGVAGLVLGFGLSFISSVLRPLSRGHHPRVVYMHTILNDELGVSRDGRRRWSLFQVRESQDTLRSERANVVENP